MGYGEWLIRRYPEVQNLPCAVLKELIIKARRQTRFARLLACLMCLELVFYGTLQILKTAAPGTWAQEAVIFAAIAGASLLLCEWVQAAVVKWRLAVLVNNQATQVVIG